MGDWPQRIQRDYANAGFVSVATGLIGLGNVNPASTAWPSANLAIFVPFVIPYPVTVYKMATGSGATAGSNNWDAGIYDRFGNRLVSTGAQSKGSSVENIVDVTDTRFGPGLFYLAMSADGTGNYVMMTVSGTTPVTEQKCKGMGIYQMATAYTLPDPATFATYTQTTGVIPAIAAYLRSY